MKIQDLEFLRLLPQFMREDEGVQGLSKGVEEFLREIAQKAPTLATWSHIDQLSDEELDGLAWELDIDWYDSTPSREVKINQIRTAQLIKKRRGTKWAVEQAVKNIVGKAQLKEWFEFDGEPFTFEIIVKNPLVTEEIYTKILRQIEKAKNVRSRLVRIYYLEELYIALVLLSKVHDGTFTIPKCGQPRAGNFKVVGKLANYGAPLPVEAAIQGRIGLFSLPYCGRARCGEEK